ncbi:MAG: cytochrome-c peroxidase [Kiritimatiellia bacterium]
MGKMNGKAAFAAGCLAAAVAVGVALGVHFWCVRQRAERRVAENKALLESFGIASDGRQDFVMLPRVLPHKATAAALGKDLFVDRRLAASQRRTCAACHWLNEGGVDGRLHGGVLTRPAVNAAFASVYLHDGSLPDMAALVARMIEGEDFAKGGKLPDVVAKLARDRQLAERFQIVYPDGLCASNVVDAIVQFERTLVSPVAALDRFCGGDPGALTDQQKAGMELFRENCLTCHGGPALGARKVSEGVKVPALRGLSQRKLYFTKGSQTDLGAVLSLMPGRAWEAAERAAFVSFLKVL